MPPASRGRILVQGTTDMVPERLQVILFQKGTTYSCYTAIL